MKFDLKKLADRAIQIAAPVLIAALAHKLVTGRFDIDGAARAAAEQAIADRAGA